MDDPRQHVIDTIKQANNVLVTVKNGPSIDQLAACIALTLILNELGKHGTAVFSGQVPSALGFLEPEKTIERNTDSLRDFIISLDKAKADKLRYKVEDTVVKIFITPYKTSLSSDDLEFGQGDFNVDAVVALGVHDQSDLDEAITAHGRILHDATVISINTSGEVDRDLGSINWTNDGASSLSEMIAGIAEELGSAKAKKEEDNDGAKVASVIDNQIATALLTGIVAETERFGNAKTTPMTMEVAAKLLTAGANQELVASQLSVDTPEQSAQDTHNDQSDGNPGGLSDGGSTVGGGDASPTSQDGVYKVDDNGELSIDHQFDEPKPTSDFLAPGPVEPLGLLEPTDDPRSADLNKPSFSTPFGSMGPGSQSDNVPAQDATMLASVSENQQDGMAPQDSKPVPEPVSGDELAALDFLKEHKVDSAHARVLQPLHGKDQLLADEPKIGPAMPAPTGDMSQELDVSDNKYALTPPSLGGTLTANMPSGSETEDTPSGSEAPVAPLLHHERPAGSSLQTPNPQSDDSADSAKEATVANSVETQKENLIRENPNKEGSSTGKNSGQPLMIEAAPLSASDTDHAEALAAGADSSAANNQANQTGGGHAIEATPLGHDEPVQGSLADLEAQVHSAEVANKTATDKDNAPGDGRQGYEQPKLEASPMPNDVPPQGSVDMPPPPALKLPTPQVNAPTGAPQASPLAPPPPVPPPIAPM